MRNLLAFFIKYPITVDVLLVAALLFGAIGWNNLNSTFFPLTPERFIIINAVLPGASPSEMEEGVVQKIEENLKGISGVDRFTSTSSENAAVITVEALRSANSREVLADVENAVNQIASFPVDLEPVTVFLKENLTLTITFAVTGKDMNLSTLKDLSRDIEDDLRDFDGISKVELLGFPEEEIEISVNEDALRSYNLNFEQVGTAIRSSNLDITGGSIKTEREELLIRARLKESQPSNLLNIVIKADEDGSIVRLNDIARVERQFVDVTNKIELNGQRAVELQIQNTDSEDILTTAEDVKNYVAEFNAGSDGIELSVINDRSDLLRQRKELLIENGVIGIILVLILLSMFLNVRVAFWVAAGLPVSFFGMFILANYFGATINVISLFGMIVVVGILVDDGIVVSENIYHQYEKGKTRLRAALDGTMEVIPPVVTAVLTTMVAFSAFFFIDGTAGDYFSEMAFIVVATLAVSLIEVLIILPSHIGHSKALSHDYKKNRVERFLDGGMVWLRDRLYRPVLTFFLNFKFLGLSIAIGLFLITLGGLAGRMIKVNYFPFIDRDNFEVAIKLAAGTREEITEAYLDIIIEAATQVNEDFREQMPDKENIIQDVEMILGPSSNEGKLNLILLSSELRGISSAVVVNSLREATGPIYDAENLSFGGAMPFGKPVSISLLSGNYHELSEVRTRLKTAMMEIPELMDVLDNDLEGVREIDVKLKDKAFLLGLNPAEVMRQVRNGFFGYEVQRLQVGEDELKVWVRYDQEERSSIYNLENMYIRTPEGGRYALREIADYSVERGQLNIYHLDGKRELKIEADLADPNGSAPDIIEKIRNKILPSILAEYPSVTPLYEGQNREAQKTIQSAKVVLPLVLILIIGLVTFTFRSFFQAIVIMLLIPFSLVGVAWGHYFHGLPLSIFSFLGIIALIGVIVNDSLVLVSKMNGYLKEGMDFKDAVYEAGVSRFRAILLTSATTIAGLAPLILEKSVQAQFLIPMAVSLAYGILMATFLTLLVLPILLSYLNHSKVYGKWFWLGIKPTHEEVEPAIIEKKSENEDL